jgi:hypothetical protein
MARIEVAVQTPLRFHTRPRGVPHPFGELPAAETVAIEFESRELVWHALGLSKPIAAEPAREWAPTVTTLINDPDDIDEAEDIFSLIFRFLSAIAFHFDLQAFANQYSATGETDPRHPAIAKQFYGGFSAPAPGWSAFYTRARTRA